MRRVLYALVYMYLFLHAPLSYAYSNTTSKEVSVSNSSPIAIDDHYVLLKNCNNEFLTGNLLDNDVFDSTMVARISSVTVAKIGQFSCGPKGNFIFFSEKDYTGTITLSYCLIDERNKDLHTEANIYIHVLPDSDCDNIADEDDIDIDNDGILNIHEGIDERLDTDEDGIPDCYDIDSDNDGITDLVEWQFEDNFVQPLLIDKNKDGWDDAFDAACGGNYYEAVDTDMDGWPDLIDDDSDNDGISDHIEATDLNNDSISDNCLKNCDIDLDGLDDAFDTISCCSYQTLSVLSNAPLPDFDKNNIRNWRDANNKAAPAEPAAAKTLNNLLVYPNPTKSKCSVSFLDDIRLASAYWQCHLYNQFGSLVLQFETKELPFEMDLSELPYGTYHLHIFDRYNSSHATVIKVR